MILIFQFKYGGHNLSSFPVLHLQYKQNQLRLVELKVITLHDNCHKNYGINTIK